jgi:hypothetical protein
VSYYHTTIERMRLLLQIAMEEGALAEPVLKFQPLAQEIEPLHERELPPVQKLAMAILERAMRDAEGGLSVVPTHMRDAIKFFEDREYEGYAMLAGLGDEEMEEMRAMVLRRKDGDMRSG